MLIQKYKYTSPYIASDIKKSYKWKERAKINGGKFTRIVTIISVTALLLGGCSQSNTKMNNAVNSNHSSSAKQELIVAIGGEPDEGFDPTTGWGRYGSPLFQSTLLKRDSDMSITGDLATNYEVSDDGLSWTVELREDVLFSDGEPLTASDVVFTFQQAKNSQSVLDLTNLVEVTASGDFEVTFQLATAQSTFVDLLVSIGIVPEHAYNEEYSKQPIGSGPYKFVQWDRGQQLIVAQNELYYGEQSPFTQLTFLFLAEDAAFAASRAGTVDIAAIPSSLSKQSVKGMRLEAIETVDNRGIMFPYVPSGTATDEGVPIGNDVTSDLAIRQAINVAIDRQLLVDGILEGYGSPAYSISDKLPWWNEATVVEDNKPELAQQILADADWKDTNSDGILEKNGVEAKFNLLYPVGDEIRQSLALAVADMIKPIGISIDVQGKSWNEIGTAMHANAVLLGWGSLDPLEMYHVYSSQFAGVGYYNPGFYINESVDSYMKQALAATDENAAIELWKKAQWDGNTGLSTQGDAPWAWLVNIHHLYLVNDKLDIGEQHIHPHGHGWPITSNIEQWKWME